MSDPAAPTPPAVDEDINANKPQVDRFEVDTLAVDAVGADDSESLRLAGRVLLWRRFGGLTFGQIQDQSGRVQVSLRKQDMDPEEYKALAKSVSLGDHIGVVGHMWTTDKGERTLAVGELVLLNKAQRSMPDKWAGVDDTETRYRKRYLDLLVNEESRQRFLTRTRLIAEIRSFLDQNGFLEVETPILQAAAAGAAARPFSTHHNALDRDFYLRISPETYLKRVVAGGFDRVYELGRNFRNEGIDSSHLQEFTMLEWYAAYWNYRDNMSFVQELVTQLVASVTGSTTVDFQGTTLDFGGDWPVLDYRAEVEVDTGVDLRTANTLDLLREAIASRGLDEKLEIHLPDQVSYAGLVDTLYKRTVRPRLVQPCFLVHHPAELVPLARRNDDDPSVLDMFQVVIHTWEVVKAYSELVDPVEQRTRLEDQVVLREAGDEETMMLEEDFIECMEYGMPPMSGLGLGIDRLTALLTDSPTLRDVVLFPQLG